MTPTPAPEVVDFIIDEEAMGELAERYVEMTPTPAPEIIEEDEVEELEMLDEDYFPEDL